MEAVRLEPRYLAAAPSAQGTRQRLARNGPVMFLDGLGRLAVLATPL